MRFFLGDHPQPEDDAANDASGDMTPKPTPKRAARKPLPVELSRKRVVHELTEAERLRR